MIERINATPPSDFPDFVIVMDRAIANRHPSKVFYLRIKRNNGDVDTVNLDGQITPLGARDAALKLGFEALHWLDAETGRLIRF